jgi:hypothetical protein
VARTFEARFDGKCRSCWLDIYEGDEIGYNADGEIACVDCLAEEAKPEPALSVCPECFIDHAGECF